MATKIYSVFTREILGQATFDAFKKLNPWTLKRNPVMFVCEIGAAITTAELLFHVQEASFSFVLQISLWLWITVLFANFAEALAEGKGRAQATDLRKTRTQLIAYRLAADKRTYEHVDARLLKRGDQIRISTGEVIPADGEVIEGAASVDESAITGESAPVIIEAGSDRSSVTSGTKVLSDSIIVQVTANPGEGFLDHIIKLVEDARRQKSPNEIDLIILLSAITLIFIIVVIAFKLLALYVQVSVMITILVALLVCLIPTTIGGLLSAIGIAGMSRMIHANVLAMSGHAVEVAGDVDVLLVDKTGTITHGNREATAFIPTAGESVQALAEIALLASLADQTPEGRSIAALAKQNFGLQTGHSPDAVLIPFTAHTRMSGVDLGPRKIRKGATDAIEKFVREQGGAFPPDVRRISNDIARQGGTPLVVVEGTKVLGLVHLQDVLKTGIKSRFDEMQQMGLKIIMITGDNPLTAASIATAAGIHHFLAEANPEAKLALIHSEQKAGHLVAMTGDGTNDAPALAQADAAVVMNTGTTAAKEAGNLIDLDSNPTKLIDIIKIGKQLLLTRGALTTFSIANDVAKYFAIIPAVLVQAFPSISPLNVMRLSTPQSAILSAIIFNALIIVALIPLSVRGVRIRPISASELFRRNFFVYALGGIIAPFIGIKLLDWLIVGLGII